MQTPPVYGVQKGALSVSTAPFNALAASNSQHTYQILVPSLNVFVDRKIVWESGVFLQSQVWPTLPVDPLDGALSTTAPLVPATGNPGAAPLWGGSAPIDVCLQAYPQSEQYRRVIPANSFGGTFPSVQGEYYEIAQPGVNFNLCPFPLQSLCNSMTCSINDCSVTTNGDTLQEQILLSNTRDTQRIRTTPSKFDQYAWTADDAMSFNGNMSTFDSQRPAVGEVPTGAWPVTFYNPNTGARLQDDPNNCGAYIDPSSRCPVYYMNGRPIVVPGGTLRGQFLNPISFALSTVADPGSLGTGVATATIVSRAASQADAFEAGSIFTITGLTGGNAIWNGYYNILTCTYTAETIAENTTFVITFRYGNVAFASAANNNNVQFVSRGSVPTLSLAYNGIFLTSDRFSQNAFGNAGNPVTYTSRLLGQVMPGGVQIMPTPMNLPMTVSFLYNVAEPMVMSPFIYQDALEFNSVGLYGCTNIQFTMNIQAPSPNCAAIQQGSWPTNVAPFSVVRTNVDYPQGGNVIRTTGCVGAFSNVSLTPPNGIVSTTGAFFNPRMVVQFLTPGPDISLPLISNVPYMEFPRYTNTYQVSDPTASLLSIQSQTITLSSIPDFIMVYVKSRSRCQLQNETYVPVQRVAVTFDNFSNLCSNMTQYELYTSSVAAGLDMDYQTWKGYTNASGGAYLTNGACGSGVTSAGNTAVGNITNVNVQPNGVGAVPPYTWSISYQVTNPSAPALAVGQFVLIQGNSGNAAALNGIFPIASIDTNPVYQSLIIVLGGNAVNTYPTPGDGIAANLGTISLPNGYPTTASPTTTFLPLTTGAFNLGGTSVPTQLSSGTADLYPATTGLYNLAGQNRFAPRATTQLTGGPLMLRMGQDVSLSPGLAPGTLGNFSIQLNLTLDNSQHFFDAYRSYQLTIVAVNSGYFETVRGQSAVRKTILNMADVESASVSSGVTTAQLRRLVGGARGHTLSGIGSYVAPHSGMEGGARYMHKKARSQYAGSGL